MTFGRNSGDDRACRNVTRHNCPRADDSTVADGHAHADHGVRTDEHVVADGRLAAAPPSAKLSAHLHSVVRRSTCRSARPMRCRTPRRW